MLAAFKKFISDNNLFEEGQSVLLAVSGGTDSSAMAHLFYEAGFPFAIAHCNFTLRGADSDGDEAFVREMAKQYNVPFLTKRFETAAYAEEKKIGIQEAARELRYEWFAELLDSGDFELLATAHHKDDHIETFFLNLLRGCGISGLHGILSKRNRIIRPLLFATRDEIEQYSSLHRLEHREDYSNSQVKYTRNKIRHQLIPVMKEVAPRFQDIMTDNIQRFSEAEQIYLTRVSQVKESVVALSPDGLATIDIAMLAATEAPFTFLFEILTPYGFKKDTIPDIMNASDAQSGKFFLSDKFRLLKDRNHFVISPRDITQEHSVARIDQETDEITYPLHLECTVVDYHPGFPIPTDKHIACFDKAKLTFPLVVRRPAPGDRFVPLGMKGHKKLSDFFIDEKLSVAEKGNIWIVCAENEVIWVINHRINNRFRVTSGTKKAYIIKNLTY